MRAKEEDTRDRNIVNGANLINGDDERRRIKRGRGETEKEEE